MNKEKGVNNAKKLTIHIFSNNHESTKILEINKEIITYLPSTLVYPVENNSFENTIIIVFNLDTRETQNSNILETETTEVLIKFLDNLKDGACIIKDDKTLMLINKELEKLIGYTQDEIIGINIFELLSPESQEKIKNHYIKYRYKGKASRYNGIIMSGDGRQVPVRIIGMPFFNQGSIAIIKDLKEIETLREKNKQFLKSLK